METPLEKYLQLVEYWKINQPILKRTKRHPGYQAHHPVPVCFQKIKQEHKNEITLQLEKLYSLKMTVMVPDRVHFELHKLLVDMFPERSQEWYKMAFALAFFMGNRKDIFEITSEEYEIACLIRSISRKTIPRKKHTLEAREKMSRSSKGKKMSDEARKNMSIAQTGRKQSPEHIAKCVAKRRGRKQTPEARENMRIAQNRPDVRAKISAKLTGSKRTPEQCENIGKSLRGRKASEEAKVNMRIAQQRPETKAKHSVTTSGANNGGARVINCYDKKTLTFVAQYGAGTEATKLSGVYYVNIIRCCRRKRKSAGGFIWRYADNPDQPSQYIVTRKSKA